MRKERRSWLRRNGFFLFSAIFFHPNVATVVSMRLPVRFLLFQPLLLLLLPISILQAAANRPIFPSFSLSLYVFSRWFAYFFRLVLIYISRSAWPSSWAACLPRLSWLAGLSGLTCCLGRMAPDLTALVGVGKRREKIRKQFGKETEKEGEANEVKRRN